jgi:hypothetical protein
MAQKVETVERQQSLRGIRALVDAVERDVSRLRADHGDASAALVHSWAALVDWLALGPTPQVRGCPRCGSTVMLEATTCGYCWARPTPPD